ncbi:hypothetical protein BDY24DRAFT_147465 [Mrakia frigida]|uniref:M28 family metallopeptidase n=1 Tax=Mrakia frigida TaxID=29902 RepID=UPI003FCC16D5
MHPTSLLALLLSSALVAQALPTGQVVLQSAEDSSFLSSLSSFEGHVEGFDLDLNAMRLVQFGVNEEPVWMSERDKILAKSQGRKFMDVTETPDLASFASTNVVKHYEFPSPNSTHVKPIIKLLNSDGPRTNLEKFTSFRTRYYRSDTGKQSSEWLLTKIQEYTNAAPKHIQAQISVSPFAHTWAQTSIIVRIEPTSKEGKKAPIAIVSAHCDSTNMIPFLAAPGADDDGSGTVSILEAYRALLEAEYLPETPVEFHWYSAEEGGLLGSQAVAQAYADAGKLVKAQQQFDMTAWVKAGSEEVVGIITDFVDPVVTDFNKALVDRYLSIPYKETLCGYACSDHASWTKAGYQSSFTIESTFEDSDHKIHSAQDTSDYPEFSFSHMLEFSKLAVAFAVEMGGFAGKE